MKRIMFVLVVAVCGCASQLDKDWLKVNQDYGAAMGVMVQFLEGQYTAVDAQMEKTFAYVEKSEMAKYNQQVLSVHTLTIDGVDRLVSKDKVGKIQPMSIADLNAFFAGHDAKLAELRAAREKWARIKEGWRGVIAKAKESTKIHITTTEDLYAAKRSAQEFATEAATVLGTFTSAAFAGYFAGAGGM